MAAAAFALLFVAFLGTAIAVALFVNTGPDKREVTVAQYPGNLLASNRTHLAVCVDRAGSDAASSDDVAAVERALDLGLSMLDQVPGEFGTPTVSSECPSPIALSGQRLHELDLCCLLSKHVEDVSQTSPYRLFVYVVPDALFAESFDASRPFARANPERLCHGDVCLEITVAIYATESISSANLTIGLLPGLGLEPKTD
jgi:hypothetical protein